MGWLFFHSEKGYVGILLSSSEDDGCHRDWLRVEHVGSFLGRWAHPRGTRQKECDHMGLRLG